ncbi:uncharacterized protein LOC123315307 [Coccinella septempunctata]|uniref:uncharacterized protein LOC123315307 n=1 Tax=Coccinella septempunctata TaxID=41139 RepID=UPI001D06811A|nr:uncharacterized protein LOC123315307 [Coccinella septempunctata]
MNQSVQDFIFVLIILLESPPTYEIGCSINTSELKKNQPLILNEQFEFFYPDDGIKFSIPKNGKLFVTCIHEYNFKLKSIKNPVVNITCLEGDTFLLGNDKITIQDLMCTNFPKPSVRRMKKKCGKSFQQIEIGFSVQKQFVRVFIVCFDPVLQNTFYSHFRLTKWISHSQNAGRISWSNEYYNASSKQIDDAYVQKIQKERINSLLQFPTNSNELVKNDNRHYLARGHLSAKADFYFAHQQSSTFFTINAAPQWQSFNGGNWKTLEVAVRKLVTSQKYDLEIYTGTYKILEISDRQIFLLERNGTLGLPVPLFFWKIVYEPISQTGVAFIGVNNPYITRNQLGDLLICHSVTDDISWVRFKKNNLDSGYVYACRLREFLKVVKNAPKLKVRNILN